MSPLTRRAFLTRTAAGAGAAATLAGLPLGRARGAGRPNVLFLAADDLNDWCGCLGGHPDARTPNIDRLAARGLNFANAHCAAPLCNASRVAMLTGLRASTTGIYLNNQPWRPHLPEVETLQQHFMADGYRVMGACKLFHNSYNDPASWHEYFKDPGSPKPPNTPVNGIPKTSHFDWGPVDVPDEAMGDHKVASWTVDKLGQTYDEPFFLAAGFIRPHLPWYVPRKYFEAFPLESITLPEVKDDDLDDVPPLGVAMARPQGDHRRVTEHDQWRQAVQGYLASIAFCDVQVGRVLDALEASPHADNTIVMFWGDHGWHLGEKLHWRKFSLWEEATRNPFMIAAPGVTRADTTSTRPVSLIDAYPTLIELCGLRPKEGLEGQSLVPLLREPVAAWDRPALCTHKRGNHSVRGERWRYTRYRDGTEELYDHDADPMEWTNLAGRPEHAAVKADMARWLPASDAEDAPTEQERGEAGGGE